MINIAKLRQVLKDPNRDISLKLVTLLDGCEVAMDGGSYQCSAETIPDRLECMIHITQSPQLEGGVKAGQIWIAGFIENNLNDGFALSRVVNDKCSLHPKAREGETVLSSGRGKNINLSNNHNASLTEPAVLGNKLVEILKAIIQEMITQRNLYNSHVHVTPAGPSSPTSMLSTGVAGLSQLNTDVRLNQMLSDLVFLQEKGLK